MIILWAQIYSYTAATHESRTCCSMQVFITFVQMFLEHPIPTISIAVCIQCVTLLSSIYSVQCFVPTQLYLFMHLHLIKTYTTSLQMYRCSNYQTKQNELLDEKVQTVRWFLCCCALMNVNKLYQRRRKKHNCVIFTHLKCTIYTASKDVRWYTSSKVQKLYTSRIK